MPSRRRSRTKNLGTNLADVQRRMRYLERRPVRTKLQRKVVTAVNIAPDSISPDEVNFPTITVESGDPTEVNLNPVQGDINIDPIDGSSSYYDITTEQYEPLVAVDPFAQETATQAAEDASTALLTADGKNAIYSQTTAPTGGTYAADDLWFDTDDGNKLYRYVLGTTYTVSNKALTNNFATLTTSGAHGFAIGQSVTVSGVDATFNGTYTVTSTTSTTFTYAKTASNVVSVSSSGSVTSAAGWISAQDTAIAAAALAAQLADEAAQLGAEAALVAQNTADGKNKIYRQTTVPTGGTYAEGDTWFDTDGDNAIYRYSAAAATSTVSNKALTLNVATLTTSTAHSFTPGESITVTGVDATFNGTYTVIAVPTTTTLTYAKTATNVTSIASSGTITNTVGWKAITLGNNAITSISATKISTGTLAAGVLYAGNINANQISTGTIASNIVYAGTVNANQINAGTLAAGVVYAGTVNADKINAGSLNVDVVYAGKINTTQLNAGTIAAGFTITSPTISGGTITAANFTSPNFASGTGIGITTSSTIDSIKFRSGGVERASFDVVSGGLLITSGSAQLVMTAAGAMSLSSASNTLLMAAAPYFLSGSGSNIGGAYGSIRNTWVDTADPSGGDAGDVWLKWS